jgi:hypothetical protein
MCHDFSNVRERISRAVKEISLNFFHESEFGEKNSRKIYFAASKNLVGNRKHEFFNFGPPFLIGID